MAVDERRFNRWACDKCPHTEDVYFTKHFASHGVAGDPEFGWGMTHPKGWYHVGNLLLCKACNTRFNEFMES